ncbi:MAG: NAD(P)H-dependent oxidoreductase [Bacteroidota bacterium]
MIIVDKKLAHLEREGTPIKVGMIGAGFFARGVALQFNKAAKGMKLVAVSNRTLSKAKNMLAQAGIDDVMEVTEQNELDFQIRKERVGITTDPFLLCQSTEIDVIIEATGAVQFSAEVIVAAIKHKKHVIISAELDGTVGPILKVYAELNGIIISNIDGDQPGVLMNLYRFLKGAGIKPVLCGNIKGLHDPYRNPDTQKEFAQKWGQNPVMVTSFADGSKISFEQAIIANATGMKVGQRGMYGPSVEPGTPIEEAIDAYPDEVLKTEEGIVDYIVGASPGPGVFIIGTCEDALQRHYLKLYKMGDGPYYCFHTPFHLCHFEVPNTVARAVLFDDAAITPAGVPKVQVLATAKTLLKAGKRIDGIGGYMVYGTCENTEIAEQENLLPLGVAGGCVLRRDIKQDEVLTYNDVKVPAGRFIDQLLDEQRKYFTQKSTVDV